MLKIGFIGSGKSVHRYHIPFILTLEDRYKVKTIYSPHALSTKWEKVEGVKYTENLADLLDDPEIDLVVVATNQNFHYHYAKMALEKNKHVVVEKPFTKTLAEAEELFSLAKEKNLIIEAYQNRRFDSDFVTLKKIINEGLLGDIYEIENNFDYYRIDQLLESDDKDKYQAFLYGHGCHTIDQMISLFGIPDAYKIEVKALIDGKMKDYFDVDLYYGKLKVSCKSSFLRVVPRPSFIAYGTKGRYLKQGTDCQEADLKEFYMPNHADFGKDFEFGELSIIKDNEVVTNLVKQERTNYNSYYIELYETIVNGKEKLVKDIETLTLMKILEEGIKNV